MDCGVTILLNFWKFFTAANKTLVVFIYLGFEVIFGYFLGGWEIVLPSFRRVVRNHYKNPEKNTSHDDTINGTIAQKIGSLRSCSSVMSPTDKS